jgi:uncharacterized membrane protein
LKEWYDGSFLIGGSPPLAWLGLLAFQAVVVVALVVVAILIANRIKKR